MFKKVVTVLAVFGVVGFMATGCGTQTSGLDTTAVSQSTEESINSSANDAIALSDVSDDQSLSVMGYESVLGSSSCPQVTRMHETAPGVYPSIYLVTADFGNGCVPKNYFNGVITSGKITATVTLFSDTTAGAITMVTIDASTDNLVRTRADGASVYITGTTNIVKTTSGVGGGVVSRTISVDVSQAVLGASGKLILDHNVALNFTVANTGVWPNISKRIINGTGIVDHLLKKVLATATLTNITIDQSCCHPVDGSITLVLTRDTDNSTIGTYTLSFVSGQCGSADLNGKSITLNACD